MLLALFKIYKMSERWIQKTLFAPCRLAEVEVTNHTPSVSLEERRHISKELKTCLVVIRDLMA